MRETAPRARRRGQAARQPHGSLVATAILAAALVTYKVLVAIRVGPGWDTYAFLANAADMAGRGTGYTEPHRPPFMPFLTSLVFRTGMMDATVIQVIDGALTLVCVIALYLLLRRTISPWLAGAGAVALLAVTPLWQYLGVGYTDTAAIGLSALALLAAIAATERDSRWYLALGPLFVAAVLTRFTAILFAFPIATWLALRWRPFREAPRLALGALLAVVAYIPAGWYYVARFGDALFPFVFAFGITETVTAPGGEGGAQAQAMYYIGHLPSLLAPGRVSWAVVGVLLVGLIGLYGAIRSRLALSWARRRDLVLAVVGVAVALAAQLGGGMVARQITIPVAVVAVWRALGARDADERDAVPRVNASVALDAAMVAWLLAYLDFHGHQTLQVPRYFITMAPPLLYLTLRGWQWLIDRTRVSSGFRAIFAAPLHAPIRVALAAAASAVLVGAALVQASVTPRTPDRLVAAARQSAEWLARKDPGAARRTIYSDMWPLTSWYLRAPVRSMPFFTEQAAFGHELAKSRADWFLTLRGRRFAGYRVARRVGPLTVLQRDDPPQVRLPRVLYLGATWDTYLESLCDYDLYLDSTAGRYGWEGTAFLDALPARELEDYPAVAVAGFRWRDMTKSDAVLRRYLDDGGTLVIDASQNLGGLAYSVADTIMFDTVIRRGIMPREADIRVTSAFAARHPGTDTLASSPWKDLETGGAWAGATYEARPGTPPLETLVWAGDRPLVQLERVGQGRIYWIGYNLAWHAFSHENADEAGLVDAIFKEALSRQEATSSGAVQ